MQEVNSIQQFQKLKHILEEEEKSIKDTESKIRTKSFEHKRARDAFEKIDMEMKELENHRNDLIHRRGNLENELKTMQRDIENINKRSGNSPMKLKV